MLYYLLIVSSSGLLFYKKEYNKIHNFQPTITASLIVAIQELASNSTSCKLRQIDFRDYSIAISGTTGSSDESRYKSSKSSLEDSAGLNAILIYSANVKFGPTFGSVLAQHFLGLFVTQFSHQKPFASHVNMSIFHGFQGKLKDGLVSTLVKTLEQLYPALKSIKDEKGTRLLARIMMYQTDSCLWSRTFDHDDQHKESVIGGVKDLQLSAQIDSMISKLTLRRNTDTTCLDFYSVFPKIMEEDDGKVVWIRILVPATLYLVLVFDSDHCNSTANDTTTTTTNLLMDRLVSRLTAIAQECHF